MPNENAIPETHIRLVATPTAGVPAEHSPYYRRLVSAGYKGFLQGNLAGASLYGAIGAGVGLLAALAVSVATGGATAPFLVSALAFGGYGILKGSATFGQIGSNAAQLAEYAEMNERRNALLDRLYETPSKEEAAEIRKLLQSDSEDKPPTKIMHFRTALIGAIIGAVVLGGIVAAASLSGGVPILTHVLEFLAPILGDGIIATQAIVDGHAVATSATLVAAAIPKAIAISAGIGAVLGSMIGIDRGWIRRWFDVSEGAVHERDYYDKIAQERTQEISRLHRIGQNEMREMANGIGRLDPLPATGSAAPIENSGPSTQRIEEHPVLKSDVPQPKLAASNIEDKGRLQELQRAAAPV